MVKYIVSLSGGKDSTAMLLLLLEKGMRVDYILNADTGVEFDAMYKHLKRLNEYIQEKYGKEIIFLKNKYDMLYYMTEYKRVRGENVGMSYGFPSLNYRWCSTNLKIGVIKRWIKENIAEDEVIYTYIGYTLDERKRAERLKNKETKRNKYLFPLIGWGITEKRALDICYERGFDWDGMYNYLKRVSCWICPFKSINEDFAILDCCPEYFMRIIEIEDDLRRRGVVEWKYKPDISAREIYERWLRMKQNTKIEDFIDESVEEGFA